jgi:3-methyl-2-oxobutanoate hydroxymethyltransferase
VKLEGVEGHDTVIRHVVESGVPVMGHLGLTPQSIHALGGYRVQGRTEEQADVLLEQALRLEALGCFSVVLECIPAALATRITSRLQVPTVGIGAGAGTDGQVLVLQDLWGVDPGPSPRFVRRFANGAQVLTDAIDRYDADVKNARFPLPQETYS